MEGESSTEIAEIQSFNRADLPFDNFRLLTPVSDSDFGILFTTT